MNGLTEQHERRLFCFGPTAFSFHENSKYIRQFKNTLSGTNNIQFISKQKLMESTAKSRKDCEVSVTKSSY